MKFYIIPKLNLVIGWNPKVACTTIKYLLLTKLGHKIEGNIHCDMLTEENLKSGKYDIYLLGNPKFKNIDLDSYTKICIIRNPYERLISGIRQRVVFLVNELKGIDVSKNTITDFLQNLKTHNYIEDHFVPQIKNLNNFKFDHVFSIEQMNIFFKMLGVPYSNNREGGHSTKYDDNIKVNYYSLTIQDIFNKREKPWSPSIESWFTHDNIQLINELYKDDFEWLGNHGFDYLIN